MKLDTKEKLETACVVLGVLRCVVDETRNLFYRNSVMGGPLYGFIFERINDAIKNVHASIQTELSSLQQKEDHPR